jgi:hypothetical protein
MIPYPLILGVLQKYVRDCDIWIIWRFTRGSTEDARDIGQWGESSMLNHLFFMTIIVTADLYLHLPRL